MPVTHDNPLPTQNNLDVWLFAVGEDDHAEIYAMAVPGLDWYLHGLLLRAKRGGWTHLPGGGMYSDLRGQLLDVAKEIVETIVDTSDGLEDTNFIYHVNSGRYWDRKGEEYCGFCGCELDDDERNMGTCIPCGRG